MDASIFREVLEAYLEEIGTLSGRILELITEGLGLEDGCLKELSQVQFLVGNHYPPCPEPSLTLGLLKHCDPTLITILVQDGDACGLQVLNNNGEWMGVAPLPNALVVNIGNQLAVHIYMPPTLPLSLNFYYYSLSKLHLFCIFAFSS